MTNSDDGPEQNGILIGALGGVQLFVAPVDAVTADVALAIVGMFTHEMHENGLVGGLNHLDEALCGAMTRLRSDGVFVGALGELLILSAPAPPIRATHVLALGLGDPALWTPGRMEQAVTAAALEAVRLRARSIAFSCSLLDSGLPAKQIGPTPAAMMRALRAVFTSKRAPNPIELWTFCAGADVLDHAVIAFREAFDG